MDVPQAAPLGLAHHQLDGLGVALPRPLHLIQQAHPGFQGVFVQLEFILLLQGTLGPFFPALEPHGVTRDDVFDAVPLLLGLLPGLFCIVIILLGGGEPLLQLP